MVCSWGASSVSKLAPDGTVIPFTSGGELNGPVNFIIDDFGDLYVANYTDRKIIHLYPDGEQELLVQVPSSGALGFMTYSNDYIYGTLINSHKIFKVDLDGYAEIILGNSSGGMDGDASVATFAGPNGIAASPYGDTLYVSEFQTQKIRMITNLEGVPSNQKEIIKASSFSISPNPIGENTLIEFELLENETVSLELRNTEGKLIQQIIDEEKLSIGKKQIQLNGSQLPSGIYFIQMTANGSNIFSEKIIR